MGHRALVAYEQAPDSYDVHYSHNGAINLRLRNNISESDPYAGGDVDQEPRGDEFRGVSLETILTELISYSGQEAFFIVSDDWEVTAWVVESFDFHRYLTHNGPYEKAEVPENWTVDANRRGVCVPVRWYDGRAVDAGMVRGRIRGMVEMGAELLDTRAASDAEAAIETIQTRIRRRETPPCERHDAPLMGSETGVPLEYRTDTRSLSSLGDF